MDTENYVILEEQSKLLNDLRAILKKVDPYNSSSGKNGLIVEGLGVVEKLKRLPRYYNSDDLVQAVMDWRAAMFPQTTNLDDIKVATLIVQMPNSLIKQEALEKLNAAALILSAGRCN